MQFPQIRIESQMVKIAIEQHPAQIELKQKKADLSIEQPKADVSMSTIKGKLTIDQTQAWEETNLMSTLRLNEKNAAEGLQAASEGTGRRAEEGSQLVDIHKGADMIAELAYQRANPPLKTASPAYIPSPLAVKFHYERGNVEMDVEVNKPNIHAEIHKPELEFYRGAVNISMEQHAELKIDFDYLA